MSKNTLFKIVFILLIDINLSAQSVGLSVTPNIYIPVGSRAEYYKTGYGGRITGLLELDKLQWLSPRFDISYSYVPLNMTAEGGLSLLQAAEGIQTGMTFGERFSLYGYLLGGGYYGVLSGQNLPTI